MELRIIPESLENFVRFVGSHYFIFSALLSVGIVVYFNGYFDSGLGLTTAPVDINDFAFAAVNLIGFAIILYGVLHTVMNLVRASGFPLLLTMVVMLVVLAGPEILDWFFYGDSHSWWRDNHYLTWVLLISLLYVCAFFIERFGSNLRHRKAEQFPTYTSLVYFILFAESSLWVYGHYDFQTDTKNAQYVELVTKSEQKNIYLVRVFSNSIITYDEKSCSFSMISRSEVLSITRNYGVDTPRLSYSQLDCLRGKKVFL